MTSTIRLAMKVSLMTESTLPVASPAWLLSAEAYQRLADVPPEVEWFANLGNKAKRRAYENALKDFMAFTGIATPKEFRTVMRAHVIAWRDDLLTRELSGMKIRHRLAALSFAVRVFVREERRHAQPGQGREAASGRKLRREDPGDRRPSGARSFGRAK